MFLLVIYYQGSDYLNSGDPYFIISDPFIFISFWVTLFYPVLF